MTPKISEKNQLFHVQYLTNGLMTGNFKKLQNKKKTKQKEGKLNTNTKYLNICMWTSLANGLRNFSCSSQYQSRSFLDSYLQNGHNFIQCICDGKHKRTKVMDLNGESDYFATFQFKARDSAPQNCLSSLQAEEVKQQIFRPYQSIQFPSQLSLVSC